FGAAVHDLAAGSAVQGGSTITMQLMKNLYGERSQRTLQEKIIEAHLALQAEQRWSKKQILERYLNGVFYGNNAIGVEAASLTFFNRHVWQLTLPQAALLAGLPQAPTSYSPFLHPASARARRNQVLDQMADQDYISRRRAARAKRAGLGLNPGRPNPFDYARQVRRDTSTEKKVEEGAFNVRTTIAPRLQRLAEEAIKKNLYLDTDPSAAIVMIDSKNGYIRAMASSQAYSAQSQFNYATD